MIGAPASIPLTELRTVDCGATMTTFDQTFKCNPVANAVEYEFEFDDNGNVTTIVTPYTSTSFLAANILTVNTTYDVRVRAKIGTTFGTYGPVCQLSTPAIIPFTQLKMSDCGIVLGSYTQVFKCDPVAGASMYTFEFTDVATNTVTTATNATTGMTLSAANLLIPNAEYEVRVKATVGGVDSPFGNPCTVFAPSTIPLTKIADAFCGLQTTAFGDNFECDPVQTATEYEFEFTDVTTPNNPSPQVVTNVTTSVSNSFMTAGITDPNKTYQVKVRAKVGGVWGNFGLPCQIKTPITIPIVQLNPVDCGATMASFSQIFKSTGASGASQYEFEFTDVTIPGNPNPTVVTQLRGHFTNTMVLANLLDVGKTYEVRIRANVGGAWGNFGPVCTLGSPAAVPTTQIKTQYCGTTLSSFSSFIYADGISGADEYEFRYTNTSTLTQVSHLRNYWNSSLNMAGITDVNTTYDVDVRVRFGADWGAYGSVCSVTSPATLNIAVNNGGNANNATKSGVVNENAGEVLSQENVFVFPNPAKNFVNIQADLVDYNVVIYNLNGKIIFSSNGENGLTNIGLEEIADGLYVVMVSDNTGTVVKTEKISVVK